MYWRAAHGHPIPEEAWPAVMFARWRIGDPYSGWRATADALLRITEELDDRPEA